jgi:hypothetical protein
MLFAGGLHGQRGRLHWLECLLASSSVWLLGL